jgi:hypothetical protein
MTKTEHIKLQVRKFSEEQKSSKLRKSTMNYLWVSKNGQERRGTDSVVLMNG